jgi:hypothetical protein
VGGAYSGTGGSIAPTPVTGIAPAPDPLSYLQPPAIPSSCNGNVIISTSTTLDPESSATPGVLCYSELTITGPATQVTFRPGIYIIDSSLGFNLGNGATLTGSGVTIYLTNGAAFALYGGAMPNLSAPLSGPYNGVVFYEDPSDTSSVSINSTGSGTFTGIFYAPSALLSVSNGNLMTFNSSFVVGAFWVNGAASVQGYAPVGGTSPILSPRLAE